MQNNTRTPLRLWCSCAVFASCVIAQDTVTIDSNAWLPSQCVPLETIGFHDEPEVEDESDRGFSPVRFKSVPFTLRENKTLGGLLRDKGDNSLFITMQMAESIELIEFSCKTVLGANREPGYSCVNVPPSDILMINPKSMRFSRAAIGSWPFPSEASLDVGSSLFVEIGQCYVSTARLESN